MHLITYLSPFLATLAAIRAIPIAENLDTAENISVQAAEAFVSGVSSKHLNARVINECQKATG